MSDGWNESRSWIPRLRPWSPAYGALLRSVAKNEYDVVILMSMTPEPLLELVALASGAVLRYGPSHRGAYPSINFEIRPSPTGQRYRGQRPVSAAAFLGLQAQMLGQQWPLPTDRLRRMQQLLLEAGPRARPDLSAEQLQDVFYGVVNSLIEDEYGSDPERYLLPGARPLLEALRHCGIETHLVTANIQPQAVHVAVALPSSSAWWPSLATRPARKTRNTSWVGCAPARANVTSSSCSSSWLVVIVCPR